MSTLVRLFAIALSALLALPAAAAQRTFVASFGLDANNCAITAPCRTFTRALTQTSAGGEIIVLDSAGYGAVTISQSVSIIAPDGVYAGISVFTGQNGITVSAGAGDTVILRGLNINNQGGNDGISITSALNVQIEKCVITGMVNGIDFNATVAMSLAVHDTTVRRSSQTGLTAGAANAPAAGSQLRVSRSVFSDNAVNAIDITDISRASISDSMIGGSSSGIVFGSSALSSANPNASVDRVQLVRNAVGVFAFGSGTATSVVNVSGSVIANSSNTGVLAGSNGYVRLSGTQVTGNETGVWVNASSNVATLGDNMVAGNATDHVGPAATLLLPY